MVQRSARTRTLLYYNDGVNISIADEEQLVNDFALAYWKYYGEEERIKELEDIANYAVEHIGDNYEKGIDYLEFAKENSSKKMFNSSFFNFNDYGWFQFSAVKHSFETNKSLSEVLTEMGFNNFEIGSKKIHIYEEINETTSTQIINDAVENIHKWGLKYSPAIQHFNKDPKENSSKPIVKYLGLLEIPDFIYVAHNIIDTIF